MLEKSRPAHRRLSFQSISGWLGVRLDALGNVLVLAIGLFGVGFRLKTEPYKLGVVLTYSLTLTQIFSQLVRL